MHYFDRWELHCENVDHMPSRYSPESRDGRSRLDNARITHTGTYKCIAKNPAGSVWQIAPAKVNIPPGLLVAPGNTAVSIADQVRPCGICCYPFCLFKNLSLCLMSQSIDYLDRYCLEQYKGLGWKKLQWVKYWMLYVLPKAFKL